MKGESELFYEYKKFPINNPFIWKSVKMREISILLMFFVLMQMTSPRIVKILSIRIFPLYKMLCLWSNSRFVLSGWIPIVSVIWLNVVLLSETRVCVGSIFWVFLQATQLVRVVYYNSGLNRWFRNQSKEKTSINCYINLYSLRINTNIPLWKRMIKKPMKIRHWRWRPREVFHLSSFIFFYFHFKCSF